MKITMLDDGKQPVSAGDTIEFCYGIPPVWVRAKLVKRGNKLIALTPGHNPKESNLRTLRRHVGGWFKRNP